MIRVVEMRVTCAEEDVDAVKRSLNDPLRLEGWYHEHEIGLANISVTDRSPTAEELEIGIEHLDLA